MVLPAVRVKTGLDPTQKLTTNHLKTITKQLVDELKKQPLVVDRNLLQCLGLILQIPQATWFSQNSE